jgi:hypothetical protein
MVSPNYVNVPNGARRAVLEKARVSSRCFPATASSSEEHPDRHSALTAEAVAIRDEHPVHNIQHNTVRVKLTAEAEVHHSPGGSSLWLLSSQADC